MKGRDQGHARHLDTSPIKVRPPTADTARLYKLEIGLNHLNHQGVARP